MNTRIISLLAATALLTAPAIAADNYNVKEAAGATIAKAAKDVTSVWFDKQICVTLADTTIDCSTAINTKLDTVNTNLTTIDGRVDGIEASLATIDGRVDGLEATTTSILAKQPAFGAAGTASADVISVQGIASGTNLNVACQSGCSGGTQYAEDAVAASGNTGTAAIGVQVASPASTAADGDWTWMQFTGGKLHVTDLTTQAAIGTATDVADLSGACTLIGCINSMRDDLRTMATDTNPLSVKTDQTTPGTTDLVHSTGFAGTATTTITRPSDAALYAVGDVFSDSTSAPTSGGFTLSSMCRASGGSGVLTDATFIYSTSVAVAGIVYLYDSAPTAQNDNAAWSVSDADQLKLVGTIPFLTVADGANAYHNVQNLNIGYTCSGSANLRFMVKITTGYTPASGDTLTIRAKFIQSN